MMRYGRDTAVASLLRPFLFYLFIALAIIYTLYPYIEELKKGTLIGIALIGLWRYTFMILNYSRAAYYAKIIYPRYRKRIETIPFETRFPNHIYFVVPSYKEDAWVSTEVFQSLLSNINEIPSYATIVVATGSAYDDSIIQNIFEAHPNTKKISLIFQSQSRGKRIAMGHALRAISRKINQSKEDNDSNSITVFMDGDTYLPQGTLLRSLPFFAIEPKLGAVTTNEIAYIDSESKWYKDWFNLKFAQRHILFQSQSISKRVLTLTGRFSIFRTSAVINEDFIAMIENDIIINPYHGKFRFLMGDDKSSWFHLMKSGWEMLYLHDVIAYSLESRDGNFLQISTSLPFRWYGNTLRNNTRARALKNQPLFIKYLLYDQLLLMWTSIVGLSTALILSLFVHIVYLPLYLAWVILVRLVQMSAFVLTGHPVSIRTLPLMLYNQWIGSFIKIRAFFNLADQKWSKNGTEVQIHDHHIDPIKFRFARQFSRLRLYFSVSVFVFVIFLANPKILAFPHLNLIGSVSADEHALFFQGVANDGKDDAKALNHLIRTAKDGTTIILPSGTLDLFEPLRIERSHISIIGNETLLLSHINGAKKAVIEISGTRGEYIGKTLSDLYLKQRFKIHSNRPLAQGDLLLIEEPNDETFVKKTLGSTRWYKSFPKLRSEIVEVAATTDNNTLTLPFVSTSHIDAGASVYAIYPVHHVTLKNLHLDTTFSTLDYKHVYENSDPEHLIDGIKLLYASYVSLEKITINNSGSSPLVFERAYRCQGDDITINGALNKGKGGNGYLRFNKSFHNTLHNVSVRDIRHIVFQWASAYNHIDTLYSEVDINFHGGASHDNKVDNVKFNVDTAKHPWGEVFITPNNARWAPPDYATNSVSRAL